MARKGNQQKNGWDHNLYKKGVSDSGCPLSNTNGTEKVNLGKVADEEELPNGIRLSTPISESVNKNDHAVGVNSRKKKSKKFLGKEKQGMNAMNSEEQTMSVENNLGDCMDSISTMKASGVREENARPLNNTHDSGDSKNRSRRSPNGLHTGDTMGNLDFSDSIVLRHLKASALSIFKVATEYLQRHKPLFISLATNISELSCYVWNKIQHAYPIVLRWMILFGNIMLLLSMVWLDCSLRGIESLLRMGTTSFLTVIWCTILSVTAMIGVFKFFVVLVTTALIGLFVGIAIASVLISISGVVLLWFCGSFWTTALVICFGGLAFMLRLERIAMLIMTLYSVYSAWTYVGWFGLLLAFNLSFISSDALTLFLKNNINEHRMPDQVPEQTARMEGQRSFYSGAGETGSGPSSDPCSGIPSTSGTDFEISSDDEVVRLLNCTDHYSALGLSRYESVDVTILKREYRKKAMLVHPDKNMGNEKAAEAFQKLQNAYEILLDSFKRKAYDDELRREELLNYFRRFQNTSQKNGRHKFFASGFAHTAADGEDPFGESKRITCKKCGNFHVWILTKKSKSSARWCQDCRDFHSGKDGDGWVEQSSHPFFFGILQKVDAPRAYVCADSKIYDATEWYICQGMRSPVNTHKPSFHVNTSKPSNGGKESSSSSGQKGGGASIPSPSSSENMTKEEFFEWLQNAVQSGVFDNFAGGTTPSETTPSAAADHGKFSKSGGGSSSSKRKKKGKKQW